MKFHHRIAMQLVVDLRLLFKASNLNAHGDQSYLASQSTFPSGIKIYRMISGQIFGLLFLLSDWNFAQGSHIPLRVNRLIPRRFGKEHSVDVQIADCPAKFVALFIITKAKTDKNLKKNVADQLIEFGKALAGAEHNGTGGGDAIAAPKVDAGKKEKSADSKSVAADEELGISTTDLTKQNDGGKNDGGKNDGGGKGFQGIFINTGSLGDCNNPKIKFGGGINGRKATEFTHIPDDQVHFTHGEALDLSIITRSSCDKLLNCKLDQKDEIFKKCKTLSEAIGKSKGDGTGADQWNSAWYCQRFQSVKQLQGKERWELKSR
ncbi:hypothetical protein H4Q26_004996 [Puccinia striiformis f. sp. tritici PST-130]|nr:hypothetical protein H4Q26_004996 [Puccinia striiformis f. sp. tritici PST-130]